jgi:hypothetical protein
MKIRSRTKISVEKHEIRTVRINNGESSAYCRTCGEQTVMLTPEQLASLLNVSVPEVCRRIDTAEIHLANNGRSVGLICGNSLQINSTKTATERQK